MQFEEGFNPTKMGFYKNLKIVIYIVILCLVLGMGVLLLQEMLMNVSNTKFHSSNFLFVHFLCYHNRPPVSTSEHTDLSALSFRKCNHPGH